MRITNNDFKAKLTKFGLEVYSFMEEYGLPNTHFCRVLNISKMAYNKKLKGEVKFTKDEIDLINVEIDYIRDTFVNVKKDIFEIYGKRK